ncbi:S8 family serine peptidase, partial [Tahibacter caeni]|uniref:S8 family serine peptidase n=1 Tax=Tahibacter caeni TaxID=1453545 RepID=UPI002147BD57
MSQRYVLLPQTGLTARSGPDAERLQRLTDAYEREAGDDQQLDGVTVQVVDAQRDGPVLVEMSEAAAAALVATGVPLRLVEEVVYPHPHPRVLAAGARPRRRADADGLVAITVTCVDARSGAPLAGVHVVAIGDRAARSGDEGCTDSAGCVALRVPAGVPIERLIVEADARQWGACRDGLTPADQRIELAPLDLAAADVVRHYYPAAAAAERFDPATGVTVGIVDTGVGPHAALGGVQGCCTVTGDVARLQRTYDDVDWHGTHVAGLIAAQGRLPGLAPGVKLRAYRAFPQRGSGATSFAIIKALMFAVADGCDIVNLSLGGGPPDEALSEALADARNHGVLVIAAVGNDGEPYVAFPATHDDVVAVAAFGHRDGFPAQAQAAGDIRATPASTRDPAEFVAAFSNSGKYVDAIAPGVAVLSTVPGPADAYAPLSGTSMAAPIVAGVAACLLSRDRALFRAPRDRAR